jgi:cell division septum initiation protein DivIVA
MSLKEELIEKIPVDLLHEPEVKALLHEVRDKNIQTVQELIEYLKKEITELETFIRTHSGPTGVKSIRDRVIKLGVCKKCLDLAQRFLL